MSEVWADYIDTCMPTFFQGYGRGNNWVLCIPPHGQTAEEAADELVDLMNGEAPPEDFPDDGWDLARQAFIDELAGVDLRFIDDDGNPVDAENMTDEHEYEDECPYVYVALCWK